MSLKNTLKHLLPPPIADTITHSRYFNNKVARRYASRSKRLDICSAQFAHYLHLLNNPPLAGTVCLEIGAGWVLSHAIVCHLLGATKVLATDIFPYAHPRSLYRAIHDAIAYVPRDILSPYAEHSLIRNRFDNLLSIRHFNFDVLRELGINYIAPINLATTRLNVPLDFIYSFSVLEHVPREDVFQLLTNIAAALKPGGTMFHAIHLEDHRDSDNAPFRFLSAPASDYSRSLQTKIGNRIRNSEWKTFFNALDGTTSTFIYEWRRSKDFLPDYIDRSIPYQDKDDLRISHVGVYTTKKQ